MSLDDALSEVFLLSWAVARAYYQRVLFGTARLQFFPEWRSSR